MKIFSANRNCNTSQCIINIGLQTHSIFTLISISAVANSWWQHSLQTCWRQRTGLAKQTKLSLVNHLINGPNVHWYYSHLDSSTPDTESLAPLFSPHSRRICRFVRILEVVNNSRLLATKCHPPFTYRTDTLDNIRPPSEWPCNRAWWDRTPVSWESYGLPLRRYLRIRD